MKKKMTRRDFLQTAALGAAALSVPMFPRVSRGAGKLALGLWDHWVPGANNILKGMIEEWGKKNKVELQIDFITSIGDKLQATAAAESRAGTGHDIMAFVTWDATFYRDKLQSVDDVVKKIQKKVGNFDDNAKWLSFQDGRWITVPSPIGSHTYPLVTRMDIWKKEAGVDVVDIFPADVEKRDKRKVDSFTWKAYLEAAKKVFKAGFPIGHPISECTDANDWLCPLFLAFGSVAVTEKGDITIESDATLEALEFLKELTQYIPKDVYGWDDAGNNRWIISGRGSSISNPPSAWTVAKRDRVEIASQMWHHDMPKGPKGRFRGSLPYTWGLWKFSKNKSAAKELFLWLYEKKQEDKIIEASQGYDYPQIPAFHKHKVWAEIGPPVGSQYNYIIRGDEKLIVGGWPAKPDMAANIYKRYPIPIMVSKVTSAGMNPKEAMKWAANELKAYLRE